uniref:Nucleoporin NUP35 n=1 Tax=Strongyloides stercoralis TaxID=6248 RepID=A0A0K0DT19_STRER
MFPRSSLIKEDGNLLLASPSRLRDSMRGSRFSTSENQVPEQKGSILNRRSSFNTYSGNGSKNYNSGRPSLSGIFEDYSQQGLSNNRGRSNKIFGGSYDVDMIEEDKEQIYDDNRGRSSRDSMPDYLFGPLSSRIPKRRSILTIDNDDETSGQQSSKGILFERPAGFEKRSLDDSRDFIKGPPLKQLSDTINLPGYARTPQKDCLEDDAIDYRELSDEDFERSCWLLVFGIKKKSIEEVLQYLNDEFGSVLKTARKNDTNYIYVRFTNPTIVKKGISKGCVQLTSEEIIGLTKPISYDFLSGNNFVMGDGFKENKNESSKVFNSGRIGVRKVDLGKNDQGIFTNNTIPKKDGIITKLWNFVNT